MKQRLALLFLAPLASAELVDVTLTLTPATTTENTLDLTLDVPLIGNSSDESLVSGTVQARIDINPDTGAISTLELLSGTISGTPVTFTRSGFFGSYNISTSVIGGTLDTPAPPAAVSGGQSAAELHEFIINSGTLTGTAVALGQSTAVNENFSVSPAAGAGTVGTFVTINSTANAGATTPTSAVYDLDFIYPIDITQAVDVGVTVTFDATGTFRATGQVALAVTPPNPYLIWAAANGIAEAPFEGNDFDSDLENGLFWALGFGAGDSPNILIPATDGSFTLELPTGGTVAEVTVETTTDLSNPASWAAVPNSQLSGANNPIPGGTTGTLTITPDGEGRFYRLSADSPAE